MSDGINIKLLPQLKTRLVGTTSRGIKGVYINDEKHLVFILTDNTQLDMGYYGANLRVNGEYIQYTVDNENWHNLIALSDLKGDKGDKGEKGDPGEVDEEQIAEAIENYMDENPISVKPLTLTGAVETEYDGSKAVSVEIPNSKKERFIGEFTLPEYAQQWVISQDEKGNPFKTTEAWIFLKACLLYDTASGTNKNFNIAVSDDNNRGGGAYFQNYKAIRSVSGEGLDNLTPNYGCLTLHLKLVNGRIIIQGHGGSADVNFENEPYNDISNKGSYCNGAEYFTKISFSAAVFYNAIAGGSTAAITILEE